MMKLPDRLWNDHGTPLLPHVECPVCEDESEVYSHFDKAGCYLCQWSGSLTAMHAAASLQSGEFALTFEEAQLRLLAEGEKCVGAFEPISIGYFEPPVASAKYPVVSLTNPAGGLDWTQRSAPMEDLAKAVGRARTETLLPREPGVVTDRQLEAMLDWRLRSVERRRALSPIGDTIAVVGVSLLVLLALAGIAATWVVTR